MYSKYLSPIGMIYYNIENSSIVSMMISDLDVKTSENELTKKINQQLKLYFLGKLKSFDIPISFVSGTAFQKLVWNELLKIPYGMQISYSKLASNINKPKAYRAVGQACKKNPIGIIVPCHRVIGKDHSLVGYSGKNYIHLKKYLLDHETKEVGGNTIE